jgi:hypothetical protein
MIHLMPCALVGARRANISALPANCSSKHAAARHVRRSKPANLRAIHIERNTARHHLDIWFGQASS